MQGLEFDSRLTGDGIVIDGNTEYSSLKNTKDLLLELIREFQANRTVTFEGNQKDDYNRRLILLENEIEGSMRRMLGYNQADSQGNIRRLDYDRLLCDKENEIVEKGSRICNLEEKLKESNERELALELETQRLNQLLVERNNMLQELRRQLEVRTSAVEKIKLQANLVNLPEMAAILRAMKEDEGRGSRADSDVNKLLAQLERDLSAVKSKLHNLDDLESTVRSWLFGLPTASKLRRTVETGELRMAQEDSYRAM